MRKGTSDDWPLGLPNRLARILSVLSGTSQDGTFTLANIVITVAQPGPECLVLASLLATALRKSSLSMPLEVWETEARWN